MAPSVTRQWTIEEISGAGQASRFDKLHLNEAAEIPGLGDYDVLVHFYYASLNYRDLIIAKGTYPEPPREHGVPGSDGAGVIEAIGSQVTRFKPGDKVVTLFFQKLLAGPFTTRDRQHALGGSLNGTLRQYGVFGEEGLVAIPTSLDLKQASTLSCAALTAWNALYGEGLRPLKPGDTVLTQGTGGVSIFALQFAKAAGARVISTTSSNAKAEILKKLGADHVINYKEESNWGEKAKSLTPDQTGVHYIVEIGGPTTVTQSLKAIKPEGIINIIGFLGGFSKNQPSFVDILSHMCTVRGVMVGSRRQFEDMNRAIDASGIKPVIDERVFGFAEVKEAYQYMWDQKHFGKLSIQIDSLQEHAKL